MTPSTLSHSRRLSPSRWLPATVAVNESVEGQLIQVKDKVTQTFQDDSPYG